MRLFGVSGSMKTTRFSLIDMIMRELIRKGNKAAMAIFTKK